MIDDLVAVLISKKLALEILDKNLNAFSMSFYVQAKPGSKVEKAFIGKEGSLIVQTRSRPVDGEANQGIVERISDLMGISKSQIEIIRGDKSKLKKIKVQIVLTTTKNGSYFKEKFTAISNQEA